MAVAFLSFVYKTYFINYGCCVVGDVAASAHDLTRKSPETDSSLKRILPETEVSDAKQR